MAVINDASSLLSVENVHPPVEIFLACVVQNNRPHNWEFYLYSVT
jgi:hypothetical protein